MKKSIILLLALSAMFSCQKNDVGVLVNDDAIYASVEDMSGTKTSLAANKDVLWSFDDRITIFKKTTLGLQYRLMDEYSGRNYGGFSKVASDDDNVYAGSAINHWVAYYPYQSNIVIKADDVEKPTGYTLTGIDHPQTQYYEQGSFSNGSFPMVALSEDNNITFKNVCGGIKFLLTGTKTIQTIRIAGNNKEQLAGTASVLAYVYGKDPVVTMTKGVYDIYLDCGKGVQLDAKKATEFIISLPPVIFTKGFTATITYTDGTTETVGTDKENVIYRSKMTVMPEINLGDQYTPVTSVTLNMSTINARVGDVILIKATVMPDNATNNTITWSSNNKGVATVDATGRVTAVAEGTATITAMADKVSATCEVSVAPAPSITMKKYSDEYGISHGTGILIGKTIWAPVNCGYHATDYPYGKLYQWGRKYGQGYSGDLYDEKAEVVGETSDAVAPNLVEGRVSVETGNHEDNKNNFYIIGIGNTIWDENNTLLNADWVDNSDVMLWNSGTEETPKKTINDPCPDGWRVPTREELMTLCQNYSSWTENDKDQTGYWFSGSSSYSAGVRQIFLPASGSIDGKYGYGYYRGWSGGYWSSMATPTDNEADLCAEMIVFYSDNVSLRACTARNNGYSVRCVQATDEVAEL